MSQQKYKVTLVKAIPIEEVFKIRNIFQSVERAYRVWEIEAENEDQIKAWIKEAIDNNLPNVRGFTLHSIEEVSPEGEEL